jgi:hypothetical protein
MGRASGNESRTQMRPELAATLMRARIIWTRNMVQVSLNGRVAIPMPETTTWTNEKVTV